MFISFRRQGLQEFYSSSMNIRVIEFLEPVKYIWSLLKVFLCLSLTVGFKGNGNDSWLLISKLWVRMQEFCFWKER